MEAIYCFFLSPNKPFIPIFAPLFASNMVYEILLKCFLIGILVSAPMGPVGMLCIQRTMNKGRWYGFVSGIGASLSDLIYALLTGMGLSIAINFIEANKLVLQLLGSILMIVFGVFVIRTHPKKIFRGGNGKNRSYYQDFVTAFLVTFANALIILYFIALFARFGFPHPDFPLWLDVAGYASIVAGALFWWFLITMLVSLLRKQFTLRTVLWINRGIGTLIIVVSVMGIVVSLLDLFS